MSTVPILRRCPSVRPPLLGAVAGQKSAGRRPLASGASDRQRFEDQGSLGLGGERFGDAGVGLASRAAWTPRRRAALGGRARGGVASSRVTGGGKTSMKSEHVHLSNIRLKLAARGP